MIDVETAAFFQKKGHMRSNARRKISASLLVAGLGVFLLVLAGIGKDRLLAFSSAPKKFEIIRETKQGEFGKSFVPEITLPEPLREDEILLYTQAADYNDAPFIGASLDGWFPAHYLPIGVACVEIASMSELAGFGLDNPGVKVEPDSTLAIRIEEDGVYESLDSLALGMKLTYMVEKERATKDCVVFSSISSN